MTRRGAIIAGLVAPLANTQDFQLSKATSAVIGISVGELKPEAVLLKLQWGSKEITLTIQEVWDALNDKPRVVFTTGDNLIR